MERESQGREESIQERLVYSILYPLTYPWVVTQILCGELSLRGRYIYKSGSVARCPLFISLGFPHGLILCMFLGFLYT